MLETAILFLLISDVFPDRFFILADRRDPVASYPEVLSPKIRPTTQIVPGYVDGTLPFDVPNNLGNRILRRNLDQHMHVIRPQVSLLDHTFSLTAQIPKHLSKVLPKLQVERLPPILGNPHNVILAIPNCVT